MIYKEKLEEDKLKQIMEQNISYLDQIAEQMKLGYLSVFAGAGLSVASGYVDWKSLLEPLCKQMRLNINKDLTEIAQYYKNQYGRQGLNDIVFNEFAKMPKNNENVTWLTKLPIKEYWTTNYDDVIEQEIEKRGKVVEKIINQESFKYHDPEREVVVYKMHGDKRYPDDVVLTKEDYQTYDEKRKLFTKLLSVELVRRTFVFIGFSFNDPNLERILSIAKNTLNSKSLPKHYCFLRKVQVIDYLNHENVLTENALGRYIQDKNYQELRIDDMRKYGIYTILVDDFQQITIMLQYLYNKYISNNVFVCGGIDPNNLSDYGRFNEVEYKKTDRLSRAEKFLTLLGKALIDNDFQIYTGFGAGVGNYILSGVLSSKKKNPMNIDVTNKEIHINSLIGVEDNMKTEIRKRMIEQCNSNKIARQITELINTDTINIFTVIREDEKEKDDEIVKNWVDEKIKGTKITILLISKETLDRKYVSYELEKSLSQRNSIIPILIDSEENAFDDEKIDLIIQKLDTELLGMKLKLRKWYQENGKENILRWLNEELEEK